MRLPPLTFSAAEAAGLVMAVLEGHRAAADPADLVGGALAQDHPGAARAGVRAGPPHPRRHGERDGRCR